MSRNVGKLSSRRERAAATPTVGTRPVPLLEIARRFWPYARPRRGWLLLSALLAGDWAIADASDPQHRREGSGLTAAFLQWHLERGIRSLRMVER